MNLKQDELKFFGNYRGKVVDNNDPNHLGRIKVNVFGVFDGIEVEELPWVVPAFPLFSGSGLDSGWFAIPSLNSYVWCFFEAGDHEQPVYFAEAPSGAYGIPGEAETNYPDRRVIKLSSGITFYIDNLDKEVKLSHPSGAYVLIDEDGNISISGTSVNINP